ncbi:MAG: hypothetical protein ACR2I2_18245 [Bryobacteraceae bacterium]
MFCKPGRTLCLLFALSACSHSPSSRIAPGVQRVAVLRFENLTPDASLDWMGRAASEAIGDEISAGRNLHAIPSAAIHQLDPLLGGRELAAPGVSAESTQARLAGATRLIYGEILEADGKFRLSAAEEDVATRKILRYYAGDGPDLLAAADKLARQISPEARAFSTRNEQALHDYAIALEEQPAEAARDYARAVAADPNFGAAYVKWSQVAQSQGDRASFEKILTEAKARGNQIPPLDRAYLRLESLNLQPDTKGSIEALSAIARLSPNDPGIRRALGDADLSVRRYADAIREYRAALRTVPENVELLNSLGYARMFAGDYEGAVQSIGEYRRLRPNEPNPLDSLGDVNYYFGRLGEAEKLYLEAQGKSGDAGDGGEFIKAAYARAMTGDVTGANEIFGRSRKGKSPQDAGAAFRTAAWQYFMGDRKAAVRSLSRLAGATPATAVKSAAEAQLALWELELGDRGAAHAHAARAVSIQASQFSALAQFLCEDEAPPRELQARAERVFPGPPNAAARKLATAYALLFTRDFTAAVPVWKEIAGAAGPADQSAPVLYAWALVASGRAQEAADLVSRNPLPRPNSVADFTFLVYPRILFLRAAVLEKRGKAAEAKRDYGLFLKLMGPSQSIFGEKERAAVERALSAIG